MASRWKRRRSTARKRLTTPMASCSKSRSNVPNAAQFTVPLTGLPRVQLRQTRTQLQPHENMQAVLQVIAQVGVQLSQLDTNA